jgi:DNA primase
MFQHLNHSGNDTAAEVKNATNIVEVIGNYIELKPAGHARYKALCPFHQEKTPSFHVSGEKQSYFCFGCEKSGDVYTFLQDLEGHSFREALQILADKAGIQLPEYRGGGNSDNDLRKQLIELGKLAKQIYQSQLNEPSQDNEGQSYLATRHLTAKTVESYGLGYVPEAWQTLTDAARAKQFDEKTLIASGLAKQGQRGGVYDHFRNRLMFPIRDTSGNIAAFGGRALGDDNAKYINSPETALYKKSHVLYGLYESRNALRAAKSTFLVEGYFDLLRCVDSGIENVVATCGTALTPGQANLIKRYVEEVIVVYDGDTAGIRAAIRSISILTAAGLTVRAMVLPDGQDPDDYILESGAESFKQLAKEAPGFIEFYVRMNADRRESIEGRTAVAKELFDIVRGMSDPMRQDEYIKVVAKELRIDEHRCREQFQRGDSERPAYAQQQNDETDAPIIEINKYDRDFIACVMQTPELLTKTAEALRGLKLPTLPIWEVMRALIKHSDSDPLAQLENEPARRLYCAAANAEDTWGDSGLMMVQERIAEFTKTSLIRKRNDLQQAIYAAQESNNKEKMKTLVLEKMELDKKIQDL